MSAAGSSKMGDRNESEGSFSGESSSSSTESSSGSSDGEEEVTEQVTVLGRTLDLPQDLCEDYAIFKEFFSMDTWNSLSDENKERLKQFLPKFTQNQEEETDKTLKMLFNFEPFHFTSPLGDFFNNLRQGNFRPDIAKMREFLDKARAEQQKQRRAAYYSKLLPELLISRERLLAVARGLPPGPIPHLPIPPRKPPNDNYKSIYLRTKQRYFEEVAAIRNEIGGAESEDENYPEGPPEVGGKRKKLATGQSCGESILGTLGARDSSKPSSLECLKKVLAMHRMRRQYRDNHPELDTAGITLEDIKQRVALVNGAKKLMFGGQKSDAPVQKLKRGPKPKTGLESGGKQSRPPEKGSKGSKKKEESMLSQVTVENSPLLPNIKIKCEQEETDSESSSFVDPVSSPKSARKMDQIDIKEEVVDPRYNAPNLNESVLESAIKQEPLEHSTPVQNASRVVQPVPIKLEDLDGIDMMNLPVEIADDSGEVLQVNTSDTTDEQIDDLDEALTETTYANFLSLVRALFPARAAHRASKQQLHARLTAVLKSPIAPLNTWYSSAEDWSTELDSALSFLSGERGPHPEDFVPYLQYMPETQMYQWIGAGRDGDTTLGRLCERWMNTATPPPLPTEPPPPRYPTSWVVRSPSTPEIIEFRAQERKRFASPAKPFTYVLFGYKAVVGPCARVTMTSAGHISLLVPDRPRHANFLALVRDAVARLPNGEGTRQDVLTLLQMSQWIAPCTDSALLTAVSSALDRLHSAKRDPLVKYEQRTAVWTYLHRHKSEEDWLKSSGGRGRANKSAASAHASAKGGAPSAPTPAAPAPSPSPAAPQRTPPHAMDMEVAGIEEVIDNGSDTDVDVDDSSSPSGLPQLSSAQLLMQAAKTNAPTPTPQPKAKGKLIAVSPPKSKPKPQAKQLLLPPKQPTFITKTNQSPPKPSITAPKVTIPKPQIAKPAPKLTTNVSPKPNLIAQITKQGNLMAQSAKQASVIAQLTKQIPLKQNVKQVSVVKQPSQSPKSVSVKQPSQSPKSVSVKSVTVSKPVQPVKQVESVRQEAPKAPVVKPVATPVSAANKSPLIKQRPLQKPVEVTASVSIPVASIPPSQPSQATVVSVATVATSLAAIGSVAASKLVPTRSLLIRAPAPPIQPTNQPTASSGASTAQTTPTAQRRGIVRVLTPAVPSGGKSLISPRALMQPGTPTTKKRVVPQETAVTTIAQSGTNVTTVVSSVPTAVTSSIATRTVQLAGGRTVQLAANQTVHLPGGQAVQLSGHTLQLSSLQLPTHSVRLPSGQTVQLASPQTIRAITTTVKTSSSKPQQTVSSPTIKTSSAVHIPISTVQIAGQTVQIAGQSVQIAGQSVQIAGQSVQLTGHTVKLPSGQSVQVASQSVLPSQSVQLPSGQTVQLASGNVQVLGQNVLSQNPVQTVQLGGQTVQLSGQTLQLGGQTVQLSSGQTVQLSSGQTIQLASGQTVQLANQQAKPIAQVVKTQVGEKSAQPIVAKLLTNAQGQMISLESAGGGGGARTVQMSGVRVVPPARPRPLLLAAKPHNIILQQSDGTAIRVTSSGGAATSQTIVLSNIGGQTATSSVSSPPILKLQQVNTIQQVKLPQGLKLQQASPSVSVAGTAGVRSVVMDAQQLKLVGGRHVLARILRPAQPHPPPQ